MRRTNRDVAPLARPGAPGGAARAGTRRAQRAGRRQTRVSGNAYDSAMTRLDVSLWSAVEDHAVGVFAVTLSDLDDGRRSPPGLTVSGEGVLEPESLSIRLSVAPLQLARDAGRCRF